tara:strand:- start:388 stop:2370 length:1983 start_codon:yes stop_codon:yes gene_type:complete
MDLCDDILNINTLRVLCVDMVENAKSGHPGMPLGCSPMLYILFKNFLNFNPDNPLWFNRDRFILSNGHGCSLLYSMLHLCGYKISLDDLKNFRKINSITPGHPEINPELGIEVTTGPLGQGFANGVGMAIASKHLGSIYNKENFEIVNNKVFVMCGDGCLMEGITNEAASLAGHLKLNNLIVLYDDNEITIDGKTNLTFTENTGDKFKALGWHVEFIMDGNKDLEEIKSKLALINCVDKPLLLCVKTSIGYGSDKENSEKSHGAPLGDKSVKDLKKKFLFDEEKSFVIDDKVSEFFKGLTDNKKKVNSSWQELLDKYKLEFPEYYKEFINNVNKGYNLSDIIASLKRIEVDKPLATRQISGMVLKNLSNGKLCTSLIGGSADLSSSNITTIDQGICSSDYSRKYINYGVREHAMAGIANGLSCYNLVPFVGTFLVFISYFLNAIRMSALSKHQVIYVLTHDSIGLGEDGPTHQPIESLTILRSIPNCLVFRPADANEVKGCYVEALKEKYSPSCICLSRQSLPQIEGSNIESVGKGGYIVYEKLSDDNNIDIIIIATGSEVSLMKDVLIELNINSRLISMPCVELFERQPNDYKEDLLPKDILKVSVEAGSTMGWFKYSNHCIGIDEFGLSGKGKDVMEHFGFDLNSMKERLMKFVNNCN